MQQEYRPLVLPSTTGVPPETKSLFHNMYSQHNGRAMEHAPLIKLSEQISLSSSEKRLHQNIKFSEQAKVHSAANNNNSSQYNNNNKSNNINNNTSHIIKPIIKTESSIKIERSLCKSPTLHSHNPKLDAYASPDSHSSNSNVNKNICGESSQRNSNPSSGANDQLQIPHSSSCDLPTQLHIPVHHSSHMNGGYVGAGMDSTTQAGIHSQLQERGGSAFDQTAVVAAHHTMMANHMNSIEDQYLREQHQLRYSHQMTEMNAPIARPTVSYPSDIVSSRVNYELATRNYDSSENCTSSSSSAAFGRYDPNCLTQRNSNMYPYMQPTMDDISQQQKYLHEQQQMAHAALFKSEQHEESTGPIYPRPIYQYDTSSGGPLPAGFSAINLSIKLNAAQQATAATAYNKGAVPSPSGPVIDLSTSSVTSSSPHTYNSSHFATQRLGSPPSGTSPHLASPQVPSPQGQTLDLSVSRLSQNRFGQSIDARSEFN